MPELRRHHFRAAVVRPLSDPAAEIPRQLSQQLFREGAPPLPSTLDLTRWQAELAPAMSEDRCHLLFLLIDQVEDVVSPLVPAEAREQLVDFLRQVWRADPSESPAIKVLISYRTDSESKLGPLWQEVSGNASGLPYHTVCGLTRETAQLVIEDVADHIGIAREQVPPSLVEELALESRSLDASGDLFPPYLQMVLTRLSNAVRSAIGEDPRSALDLGSVGDLIGDFMRDRLRSLQSRGGDFAKTQEILVSLSRSTGQKLAMSIGEIAAEVGLSPPSVVPVLEAMQASRLIRPVRHETYEIQHDRLAEAVVDSLSDEDLEFKAACELLSAKAINHPRTGQWLEASESALIYHHRHRLKPTRSEQYLILGGLLKTLSNNDEDTFTNLGWCLIEEGVDPHLLRELARDNDRNVHRLAVAAIGQFAQPDDLRLLRELARDDHWKVRQAAGAAIGQFAQSDDLPLLRELARDDHEDVRQAAVAAIGQFAQSDDLPLLRQLARDDDEDVSQAAVAAIGQLAQSDSLPLLRELARDDDEDVRQAAVATIGQFARSDDLPLLRELARDDDEVVRQAAGAAIGQFAQSDDLPLLRELARDDHWKVRQAAGAAIGQFARSDDLPLLRELARDDHWKVRHAAGAAIGQFARSDDLPLLRELARDDHWNVGQAAGAAIVQFAQPDALPLLRQLARDDHWNVRQAVGAAIGQFAQPDDLRLLRELARDDHWKVRQAAGAAIGQFAQSDDLPLLRELARDDDEDVRQAAVAAIGQLAQSDSLPLLRELARDGYYWKVRQAAVATIGQFAQSDALPLLRELARDYDEVVRQAGGRHDRSVCSVRRPAATSRAGSRRPLECASGGGPRDRSVCSVRRPAAASRARPRRPLEGAPGGGRSGLCAGDATLTTQMVRRGRARASPGCNCVDRSSTLCARVGCGATSKGRTPTIRVDPE